MIVLIDEKYIIKSLNIDSSDIGDDNFTLFDALPAHPSQDAWAFGAVLYNIFSGCSLFFGDNFDNLATEAELRNLSEFTDVFKAERLEKIEDKLQRNLVSQLLMKDPKKRPSMKVVLQHPYITGHAHGRLIGQKPGIYKN